MSVDALLSRLDGVRRTGAGRWVAKCAAHNDKHPSLSVRELGDGRVLVHCFGGCASPDVLAAVGLDFAALFPLRQLGEHLPRERRPFDALSVLRCIATEAGIASLAADNLATGMPLTDADRDRLRVAAIRLRHAEELARG